MKKILLAAAATVSSLSTPASATAESPTVQSTVSETQQIVSSLSAPMIPSNQSTVSTPNKVSPSSGPASDIRALIECTHEIGERDNDGFYHFKSREGSALVTDEKFKLSITAPWLPEYKIVDGNSDLYVIGIAHSVSRACRDKMGTQFQKLN